MSPDHWSKLTWDTVSAGGYDLFDPIGYLDRKRDRAYKQRVIVTPANQLWENSSVYMSVQIMVQIVIHEQHYLSNWKINKKGNYKTDDLYQTNNTSQ